MPRDLHILTCGTHFTVSLSEQPLRKPSVLWSKACSSAWRARMGRRHHLHGLSGTAKGRQRRWSGQKAGFLEPGGAASAKPTISDPIWLSLGSCFCVFWQWHCHECHMPSKGSVMNRDQETCAPNPYHLCFLVARLYPYPPTHTHPSPLPPHLTLPTLLSSWVGVMKRL